MKYIYSWGHDPTVGAERGSRDWMSSPTSGEEIIEAADDQEALEKIREKIPASPHNSIFWIYAIGHEVPVPKELAR